MTTDTKKKPRTLSNELRAMHRIDTLLSELPEVERDRVLARLVFMHASRMNLRVVQTDKCNAPPLG